MIDMDSIIDISNSNTYISKLNQIYCWSEKTASFKKLRPRISSMKEKYNSTEFNTRTSFLKE